MGTEENVSMQCALEHKCTCGVVVTVGIAVGSQGPYPAAVHPMPPCDIYTTLGLPEYLLHIGLPTLAKILAPCT